MRRSSTAFSLPLRPSSPTPSERERDSDSTSIKGSSKPTSLRQVDTLVPSSGNVGHMAPSPIAESPAREAAELASDPIGPSPLAGDVLSSSPVETNAPTDIPTVPATPAPATPAPATPAPAEQQVITSEPEAMTTQPEATPNPVAEEEPVPRYSTNPPTEAGQRTTPPSIHVEDTSVEAPPTAPAAPQPENSAPRPEVLAPVAAPPVAKAGSSTGITSYFEIPAPQAVPPPGGDYSTQIWAGQGQRGGVSAKPSNTSLATSAGWGNGNAEYEQGTIG